MGESRRSHKWSSHSCRYNKTLRLRSGPKAPNASPQPLHQFLSIAEYDRYSGNIRRYFRCNRGKFFESPSGAGIVFHLVCRFECAGAGGEVGYFDL